MFYLKFFLTVLWFFTVCILILPYSLLSWRNPSNGAAFAYLFSRVSARILGIKVVVINRERLLASQPCVYVGNHQDTADLVLFGTSFSKNTAIIGKRQLLWIPLFGWVFYLTGNIMLHRRKHEQAIAKMKEAAQYIIQKKYSVLVFAEGTRNQGVPQLLPFKKGAFHLAIEAQVPIVPVVAGPNWKVVDVRKKKLYGGTTYVEVLEPIPTKGLTEEDVDQLLAKTQAAMQQTYTRLSNKMSGS